MVYEVDQDKVTQAQYDEMKKIAERNVCAVCGAELTIHTVAEHATLAVGCSRDHEHHGYIERASYTALMRRGEVELHPSIQAVIEKKMMPGKDLQRAMNILALRFPRTIENVESAALFINDCMRLGLDPLIQPAEAVPVAFKSKKGKEEKTTVAMVITEDGWLSMCARGCPEEWNGPPRTMRLEEYLSTLPENKKLNREEIAKLAKEIKESACKDPNAYYYVAIGRSKKITEDAIVPGWFTKRDMDKATKGEHELPAAQEPGNQARVRAIKKWVRHVYPECRQRMIALTREWYERAGEVKEAQKFIDAEYSLLLDLPVVGEKTGEHEATGKTGEKIDQNVDKTKTTKQEPAQTGFPPTEGKADTKTPRGAPAVGCTCPKPLPPDEVYSKEDNSFWHVACGGYLCTPPLDCFPGCPHMPFEKEAPPAEPAIVGDGFSINLKWLDEGMKRLKWNEKTMLTFLAAEPYKVGGKTVAEALGKLTRPLAETFVKEINRRLEKTQASLL